MLYNIFLVFTVQHCELAIGIHIGPPSWASHPPSHSTLPGHQIAWRWAPRAVQQLPGSYLFYTRQWIYVNATLLSFLVILHYVSFYMSFHYNYELLMYQNSVSSFQNIFATSVPTPTRTWFLLAAAAAKSLQSCPTLCNPIDGSPPGSLVPGILQARTLEWAAISFSNA